jgi:uncharacterized protein
MPHPAFIEGLQFARDGHTAKGRLGLESLDRLAGQGCTTAGLDYSVSGGVDGDGAAFLLLRVTGDLELVCQRCLGKLVFPLDLDSRVELAKDWNKMINAEDDVDRVLAEKAMSVAALVEDEVILALPMVPRHERCDKEQAEKKAVRTSPFDVLAGLKSRPSGR